MALAALNNYTVQQLDVSTAYLHANIDEELYMKQPEGYEKRNQNGEPLVCKLKKSIYGLKQAGRNWNKLLDQWLKDYKMKPSLADPCLYILNSTESRTFLAITIYVDDIITVTNNQTKRNQIIDELGKKFKITDLGRINWILGTHLEINNSNIKVGQEAYTQDILSRFKMTEAKPVQTPTTPNNNHLPENQASFEDKNEFLSLIGSLTYLSVVTRPDIAYATAKAGQKMQCPTIEDWKNAKRILRYLKGEPNLKLIYSTNGNDTLIGYADSDWAGDSESRKSTSGYCFLLGGGSNIVDEQETIHSCTI